MTDHDRNLKVLTDHVIRLAGKQQAASGRITLANQAVTAVSATVLDTHGVACLSTHLAVSAAQTARSAAGAMIYRTSTELEERLHSAAALYSSVDYQNGKDISACEV